MIKNERQLRLASAQIQKLLRAEQDLETRDRPPNEHPRRKRIELTAVRGQLAELRSEVEEYEALREGRLEVSPVRNLSELPRALIRKRIASGMTQRDLANLLGVAEQQVQRDEANDYVAAGLDRLNKVAAAVGISMDLPIWTNIAMPRVETVVKRLAEAGFDKKFIERRLMSKTARTQAASKAVIPTLDFTGRLTRMFGWNPSTILGEGSLELPSSQLARAYKKPKKASNERFRTLTAYVDYCARLIIHATDVLPREIPDAQHLRAQLSSGGKDITFRAIVCWAWDNGMAVFPLNEPGGFHALVMRTAEGRSVIVLKQGDHARWSFDLLHEIGHLARHPDGKFAFIDETSPEKALDDIEEIEASRFASEVLLGKEADALSDEAISRTGGLLPHLKEAVRYVAGERAVSVGALAFHTAFRLSRSGEQGFWGAAVNLAAENDNDNHQAASDALFKRIHWNRLNEVDHDILLQALTT